jgi:hypothetical protein
MRGGSCSTALPRRLTDRLGDGTRLAFPLGIRKAVARSRRARAVFVGHRYVDGAFARRRDRRDRALASRISPLLLSSHQLVGVAGNHPALGWLDVELQREA